ncbi:MAG: amidohydrolase [SAR86 cluster bacterium BACL1 MAG-120820-bin45]|uniref:Amidohydrolase n=1 Tax=SAR86 cluster bacterium BACL1 MAG-120820-bin45 TaxID=1655612 RepID=A0A0R2U475_9GAMM|nr:MAG: amidohydrolase [SAR86 cluster bacterium BACL1 MAG-120820-bin45]
MGRQKNLFQKQSSLLIALVLSISAIADTSLDSSINKNQDTFQEVALKIWDFAEVGYQEYKSSELLQSELKAHGFNITAGIADMPTAFIAEYSNGGPVIGILGEYDALPGLMQTTSPFKEERDDVIAGHACGHHMFGAASAWAAVAVKDWLVKTKTPGTIRFYGTPAEEGGSGKVYMVRAGLFNDVDAVLHWHPSSSNTANAESSNSNKSAKFRFSGVSAHAAGSPHKGRSALDGVEAMNMMVNMMREHIPQESRIHYVITKGGLAPNVVPDAAEVYYYVRNPRREKVQEIFDWVVKASEGAALGTETTVTHEVMHGNYSKLANDVLQKVMHKNLVKRGGIKYTKEEQQYAKTLYQTLVQPGAEIGDQEKVAPYKTSHTFGSTDVGDVSWVVPQAGLRTATWVPGTAGHSWQGVAAGGTSIGMKGTKLAAQVLADTAQDIFKDPSIIQAAHAEYNERVGENFKYVPLLGDRDPPLDYRN